MKNFYLKLSILALLSVFIYSCSTDEGAEDEEEEMVDPVEITKTFGIRHDKTLADYEAIVTATGDYPDFGAVVYLTVFKEDGSVKSFASGVLIDEEWILTAGHNFFISSDASPTMAANITVKFGNDPNDTNSLDLDVSAIVLHPTWVAEGGDIYKGNDLCLLKLSAPITDVTPAAIFTQNSVQVGSQSWFSGFGDYSAQPGQNADNFSKKHAYQNILDRKTDDRSTTISGTTYAGGHLAYDFDNPEGTVNSLGDDFNGADEMNLFPTGGTSAIPLLEYEAGSVIGDSGGPIFVKDGSVWKVAGVLSGGLNEPIEDHQDSGYGDISLFTRTFPMLAWIQSVIQ